jgi:hypothetical protein
MAVPPLPSVSELQAALLDYQHHPTVLRREAVRHAARWVANDFAGLGWELDRITAEVISLAKDIGINPSLPIVAEVASAVRSELPPSNTRPI